MDLVHVLCKGGGSYGMQTGTGTALACDSTHLWNRCAASWLSGAAFEHEDYPGSRHWVQKVICLA